MKYLLCIGTGGVFFHAQSQLIGWCLRRGDVNVICVDPDVVEKKNIVRQWPQVGKAKALLAAKVFKESGVTADALQVAVQKPTDLVDMVVKAMKRKRHAKKALESIIVVHTPDMHMVRVLCHNALPLLYKKFKVKCMDVTAGNTLTDGYGFSSVFEKEWVGDWMLRHPDILETAQNEIKELEAALGCGALAENDKVEQTAMTNMLTAHCLSEALEEVWHNKPCEKKWSNKGKETLLTERYADERKIYA
jgi:hypothetical protein